MPLLPSWAYLANQALVSITDLDDFALSASHQGGSFLISASFIYLCLMIQKYGVFSMWVISSSSGGQPRAITTASIVLGVSVTTLTNNLRKTNPTLGMGLFIWQPISSGKTAITCVG